MFKKIISKWQENNCEWRVRSAITFDEDKGRTNGLRKTLEYENIVTALNYIELTRFYWKKFYQLKNAKEEIAIFALAFYLIDFQEDFEDGFLFEKYFEISQEDEDLYDLVNILMEKPKNDYKFYILKKISKKYKINNAHQLFEDHLSYLHDMPFHNFILSPFYNEFHSKFLYFFIYTDDYKSIDINKKIITNNEDSELKTYEQIKLHELGVQFMTLEMKNLNFDEMIFEEYTNKIFIEKFLIPTLNSKIILLRNIFNHLY